MDDRLGSNVREVYLINGFLRAFFDREIYCSMMNVLFINLVTFKFNGMDYKRGAAGKEPHIYIYTIRITI